MELPLSRLDLNLLTVFDMLMQERNVTRAAERLHLSQSTVSHALGRLRQALDDPLFVMSRREMMPTERAKALASPVRQALAMLEQGLRQAKDFDPANAQRVFRIATPGSVEHGLVPMLVEGLFGPAVAANAGAAIASILIYVLMAAVLFYKPQGLFPAHG